MKLKSMAFLLLATFQLKAADVRIGFVKKMTGIGPVKTSFQQVDLDGVYLFTGRKKILSGHRTYSFSLNYGESMRVRNFGDCQDCQLVVEVEGCEFPNGKNYVLISSFTENFDFTNSWCE